jgi:hypothetical protein
MSEPAGATPNGAVAPGAAEEIDEEVEWLTDEEYERFRTALEQADREAKAWMRREMGLE